MDPTEVLTASLADLELTEPTHIRLLPREQWLEIYAMLTAMPETASQLHGAILQGVQNECAYAALFSAEGPLACGLAVLEQHLVGLFDIYTHDHHRGQGHAGKLVGELLSWARGNGADTAYLQMVSDNLPARRVYDKFGFLLTYEYWYRVSSR